MNCVVWESNLKEFEMEKDKIFVKRFETILNPFGALSAKISI
jgi:hypothetical protein